MNSLIARDGIRFAMRKGALPLYPIAFAAYPISTLLLQNRAEVHASVAIRPLFISLSVSLSLLAIFRIIAGSWRKSALLTTIGVVAFFTYGHVYAQVRNATFLGMVIGRHRYLLPFLSVVLLIGVLLILRTRSDLDRATKTLNVAAVTLVLIPLVQFGTFLITSAATVPRVAEKGATAPRLNVSPGRNLPDIYFIVLDTYTRADALKRDFAFDNSAFIEALEDRGFFVADCARSNYSFTSGSLASALNFAYLDELLEVDPFLPSSLEETASLMRHSKVRGLLEEVGYQTVAFETGYEWANLRDADYFLSLNRSPITLQHFDPFEEMLINNTALRVVSDLEAQRFESRMRDIGEFVSVSEFSLASYVDRQLYIFDQLPEIARLTGPTFTFVHINTPHVPYVFDPEGNIWSDEGFYYGRSKEPFDEWYLAKGYTSAIQYTNVRILEAIDQIFKHSRTPPIIIMQGDHGMRDNNRMQILNSYFLPEVRENQLYSSISPVN